MSGIGVETQVSAPRFEPRFLHVAFIALVTLTFYAGTIDNYWIKDDLGIGNFTEGGEVTWNRLAPYFWPSFMEQDQYWRPIPLLPGYLEWKVWGANPTGYHVTNTLLHALVGILVYFLVNRLTNFVRPGLGLVAALAFVVNPLHGESVVWILQRMVLMCAGFSLAALLSRLRAAESDSRAAEGLSLALLIVALLCKEIAVTLPGVFFLIDWWWAPAHRSLKERFGRAVRKAIPCALILVAYMGGRYALWGRFDLLYAGLTPTQYAAQNRVFELLPSTLFHGFVPVNVSVFENWSVTALRATVLASLAWALVRGLFGVARHAHFRRAALVFLTFFALTFLPTIFICWIDERLFNARFFYEPSIAIIGLWALCLWFPSDDRREPATAQAEWPSRLATLGLIMAFGIAFSQGLTAFEDGGRQVRGIQLAALELAEQVRRTESREPLLVALDTPSQVRGVPTLESSLALALRPPLAEAPGVDCIPLVDAFAHSAEWPRQLRAQLQRRGLTSTASLFFVACTRNPPGVRPVFPPVESAEGLEIRLLGPDDNHFTTNAPEDPEPDFCFEWPEDAARMGMRLDAAEIEEPIRIGLSRDRNLRPSPDGSWVWRPSLGCALNPDLPDLWAGIVKASQPHPIAMMWRLEAFDGEDRLIGVSEVRRLLVFDQH